MYLHCIDKVTQRKPADLAVIPCWQGTPKKALLACEAEEFKKYAQQPIQSGDFLGKEGETLLLYRPQGKEKRILLLGLGKKAECVPDNLRRAYAACIKVAKAKRLQKLNLFLPSTESLEAEIGVRALIEGVLLTDYQFLMLKGEAPKEDRPVELSTVSFIGGDKTFAAKIKKTEAIIHAVNIARDLVNGNADEVTSGSLTALAKGLAQQYPTLVATVLGKEELEKEKMGLLLAVNRGAARDPALIILEYQGDPGSKDWTAIVGKGITYDTGGLNIKPTGNIETMKCDMAGAAAAFAVARAAAQLKLKKNILAVLVVAENAVGPHSYKPGDVFRSHSGKTVEITNTDAEGRLVLADAFSYVQKHYKPSRLIDMATLTGAIVVALGEEASGLFSNNDKLAKALHRSGERTHERLWRMPIYSEHKEMLKSPIADIKNSAGRKASSCTAAAFLQQFIKGIPWAHLDIAGSAYLSEPKGYHTTPATGVGVRLLIDFLEHLNEKEEE